MKKIKLFLLISISVFLLTGCDNDPIQNVYTYGITSFESSTINGEGTLDLLEIENYFHDKDVLVNQRIFEDKSTSKTDAAALDLFNENVAKIKQSELAEVVKGKTSFKYGVYRVANDDVDSGTLKEVEFKFNKK